MLPQSLSLLGQHRQFILYVSVTSTSRPGKTDKFPCSPITGQVVNAHDPQHWTDAATAYATAPLFGANYGVGFVLTAADRLFCLDIDNCLQADNTWSPVALDLCASLPGCAIEVSQSGRGLHIWGMGELPPHACKNTAYGIELYETGRFIALGHPNVVGNAATDCTTLLPLVIQRYFPPTAGTTEAIDWTDKADPEWRGPEDDDELLRRMLSMKQSTASAFGGRATIQDLWDANEAALIATYPSASDSQSYGASEADAALAAHLAFWTGRNCERMRRLMMRSKLVREKWEREDYLQRTIARGCAITQDVYKEKALDVGHLQVSPATAYAMSLDDEEVCAIVPSQMMGRPVEGHVFMSAAEQLEFWRGYVYIAEENIVLTDVGLKWDQSRFNNLFGGFVFTISTDNGAGSTTKDAWEAFVKTRANRLPKADCCAFRPDLEIDKIWREDGIRYANSYRKLEIESTPGDAAPFLNHLRLVVPNERDRTIFLSYMAGTVQHPGRKFQWAIFLQGTEGNGKSLFSRCVERAVGYRYTHYAKPEQLAEKFNEWQLNKIFIAVDDVWYPEGRSEIFETLKPMITNSRLPIRGMGKAERTMNVCANWILNSNHKDGIRKTARDRRICAIYSAQQSPEDLVRDGMDAAYFHRLYRWLDNGGYAIVTHLLQTFAIPEEFNLENCLLGRAPETSSTAEAIVAGLGRIEQEVMEAIMSGQPGFMNGWVSSTALDELLVRRKLDNAMPRSKRRELMKTLGYIPHGALRDGRITSPLPVTLDRPILYLKHDHFALSLKTSAEIVKAYDAAQKPGANAMGVVNMLGIKS